MKTSFLICVALLLTGCDSNPVETITSPEGVSCTVVKFSVSSDTGSDPICAVECNWKHGAGTFSTGYSNATTVPCSWYGRKITRQ